MKHNIKYRNPWGFVCQILGGKKLNRNEERGAGLQFMKIDSIYVSENHKNTVRKGKDYLEKVTRWHWNQLEKGDYPNEIIGKSHIHTHTNYQ